MKHFSKILIRPIVTEKMTALQETENKYAFEIPSDINKIDVVTTNTFMAFVGFVVLIILSIFIEGETVRILKNIDLKIWFLIVYSGLVVSVGAHMSLFYLYKFYPVGKVLPFYSLFPVFGLIQTFIVFKEIPSLMVTLGGIIVIGSVFILQKIK